MMKAAAALTASWATAGEIMDRRGVGGPRRPQTLGGHTATSVGGLATTMTRTNCTLFVFVLVHH